VDWALFEAVQRSLPATAVDRQLPHQRLAGQFSRAGSSTTGGNRMTPSTPTKEVRGEVPYAEPNSAADFAIVALLTLGANASAVEI